MKHVVVALIELLLALVAELLLQLPLHHDVALLVATIRLRLESARILFHRPHRDQRAPFVPEHTNQVMEKASSQRIGGEVVHDGDADDRVKAAGPIGEEETVHQCHFLSLLSADRQELDGPVAAQQAQAPILLHVTQVLAVAAAKVQNHRARRKEIEVFLDAVPLRVARRGEVRSDLVVDLSLMPGEHAHFVHELGLRFRGNAHFGLTNQHVVTVVGVCAATGRRSRGRKHEDNERSGAMNENGVAETRFSRNSDKFLAALRWTLSSLVRHRIGPRLPLLVEHCECVVVPPQMMFQEERQGLASVQREYETAREVGVKRAVYRRQQGGGLRVDLGSSVESAPQMVHSDAHALLSQTITHRKGWQSYVVSPEECGYEQPPLPSHPRPRQSPAALLARNRTDGTAQRCCI